MIDARVAKLLLQEHQYKPFSGYLLTIGKQDLALKIADFPDLQPLFDAPSLDVSAYEGAGIIHDMNKPIPEKWHNTADVIFNGSCMDNLFSPAQAIINMSMLLKPGGRVIHIEHGSNRQTAYIMMSPAWFFDFYAVNGYADCKPYVCSFNENYLDEWDVQLWEAFTDGKPSKHPERHFVNFVIAEKGFNSTNDEMPIQGHYRDLHADESRLYHFMSGKFNQSHRPIIEPKTIGIQS